jgi:hypothetical protein
LNQKQKLHEAESTRLPLQINEYSATREGERRAGQRPEAV